MSVVPRGSRAGRCIDAIGGSGNGRDRRDCLIGLVCSLNRLAAIRPSRSPPLPPHPPFHIDPWTINFRLDDGLRCTSTRYGYQTFAARCCPLSTGQQVSLTLCIRRREFSPQIWRDAFRLACREEGVKISRKSACRRAKFSHVREIRANISPWKLREI